jgi:hypothetical protein
MRRIVMLLTVVALMMVMLAMSVAPAFARGGPSMSCLAAVFSDYKAPICPGVYHPGGQP